MRKLAPVFIAASVLAISSTAFAFGDKRDNKAAPSTSATTTMPSSSSNPSSSTRAPASAPMMTSSYTAPGATTRGAALEVPVTGASDATTSGSSMGAKGSMMSSGMAPAPMTSSSNTTSGAFPEVPVTGASDATTLGSSKGARGPMSSDMAPGSMSSGMAPDKSTGKSKKAAAASNDATRCDASRYPSGTAMPKDCLSGAKGGAAVGSTQGQSGK